MESGKCLLIVQMVDNMKTRDKEYRLLKESTILQQAYMNAPSYKRAIELQKRQDEVYKKWLFFKKFRKEVEKENDKVFRHSNSK